MSEAINLETKFFLISVLYGIVLLLIYDALRIFRILVKHYRWIMAIEDIIYWVGSSIFIFHMMYTRNNGIIRGFAIMGMVIGMILYNQLFSNPIVKGTSSLIESILKLIKKIIKIILKPFLFIIRTLFKILRAIFRRFEKIFRFFGKRIKKIVKFVLKGLKKLLRTVKISITKN